MNQRVKQLWLTALRSGKYLQGTGCLKRRGGDNISRFCCLGVLCDVYAKETKTRWVKDPITPTIFKIKNVSGALPRPVMEWAEVNRANPWVPNYQHPKILGDEQVLSECNDFLHLDFNQIADLIEEGL